VLIALVKPDGIGHHDKTNETKLSPSPMTYHDSAGINIWGFSKKKGTPSSQNIVFLRENPIKMDENWG
jgi:hypothetical protein